MIRMLFRFGLYFGAAYYVVRFMKRKFRTQSHAVIDLCAKCGSVKKHRHYC